MKDTMNHYTVKPGDTLWGIAQSHNTTIQTIVRANSWIEDIAVVKPGWVFHVPTGATRGDEPGTYKPTLDLVGVHTPTSLRPVSGLQMIGAGSDFDVDVIENIAFEGPIERVGNRPRLFRNCYIRTARLQGLDQTSRFRGYMQTGRKPETLKRLFF